MKGFNQCAKGHFYKESMDECPYCPKGNAAGSEAKTEVLGGGDSQKTSASMDTQKTQVFGGSSQATPSSDSKNVTSKSQTSFDATKTIIGGSNNTQSEANDNNEVSRRKLRGWLVTYDIEEFGIDFRVIEGRNIIGSNPSNDITIQDGQVSSTHALILCKKDKFIITDELSSNGTLLNGEDLTPREPFTLNDGDEIRVGETNLLFKTAFKN